MKKNREMKILKILKKNNKRIIGKQVFIKIVKGSGRLTGKVVRWTSKYINLSSKHINYYRNLALWKAKKIGKHPKIDSSTPSKLDYAILYTILTLGLFTLFPSSLNPFSPFFSRNLIFGEHIVSAKNKNYSVDIGIKKTKRPEVEFTVDGHTLTMAPLDAELSDINVDVFGKKVTFKNLLPNIDFVYKTLKNGLKEEIILKEKTGVNEFVFRLNLESAETGEILQNFPNPVFYDSDGNYLYHFEKPFAVDNNGERTDNVSLQVRGGETDGEYQIRLVVDPAWLNDEARAYPVTIDPTIVHDSSSEFANGEFNRTSDTASPQLETYYQELASDEHTVALWHMDEGDVDNCSGGSNDVCDASGNGHDGAFNGTAVFQGSGKVGSDSVLFDGDSDYITVADSPDWDFGSNDFSIEWWEYRTLGSTGSINRDETTVYTPFLLGYGNTMDVYMSSNGSSWDIANAETMGSQSLNEWAHFAVTRNGSNFSTYKDGVLQNTWTSSGALAANANSLSIGRAQTTSYFDGAFDEIRISNVARTPEEIKASASRRPYSTYTSPIIDLGSAVNSWVDLSWSENGVTTGDGETVFDSTNLVAQWNFNETSGTTANNDAEGTSCGGTPANCDGTLSGFDSTASQDADPDSSWTANNRRWGVGALQFDGTDSYVSVSDDPSYENSTGSIEFWFKTSASQTSKYLISKNDSGNSRFSFYQDSNDKLIFWIRDSGGSSSIAVTSKNTINDGEWHYVTGLWGTGGQALYIDGVLQESNATTTWWDGNTYAFEFGRESSTPGFYWKGVLDSIRIYSARLTEAELLSNYNSSNIQFQTRVGPDSSPNSGNWEAWKPTTTETSIEDFDYSYLYNTTDSGLVSYWPMDETVGGSCSGGEDACDVKGSDHGTDSGGSTIVDGKFGNARGFDGNNDFIDTGTDILTQSTSDAMSFTAWINRSNSDISAVDIVAQIYGAATFNGKKFGFNSTDDLQIYIEDDDGDYIKSVYAWDADWDHKWIFVAGTYDGSQSESGMDLYINGQAVSTTDTSSGVLDATVNTTGVNTLIGAIGDSGTAYDHYFEGSIDEVRIYNTEISATTIFQQYVAGSTNPDSVHSSSDSTIYSESTASEKIELGRATLDESTVALWHFDETNGDNGGDDLFDETANNNDGEFVGSNIATAVVDGIQGKARDFDGSTDYISCSNSASLSPTDTVSVEAWVKIGAISEYKFVLDRYETADGYSIRIDADGTVVFGINGGSATATGTTSLEDNKWHHIAGTYDKDAGGTTEIKVYVDGVKEGTGDYSTAIDYSPTPRCQIGVLGASPSNYFDGTIDELRVSSVARTKEEIVETYRAGRDRFINKSITSVDLSDDNQIAFDIAADRPGTYLEATFGESAYANYQPDANTVGLWHLDEGTNNACNGDANDSCDSSGNGNHGDVTSAPPIVQGIRGKARDFDGSADIVTIADSTELRAVGNITMEAWIKTSGSNDYSGILNKKSGNNGYQMSLNTGGGFRADLYNGATYSSPNCTTNTNVEDDNWHYLAVTYDGSTAHVYLDGTRCTTSNPGSGYVTSSTASLIIGNDPGTAGRFFNGIIDEARISDTARTAEEIRQAYEIGRRTHSITIDFAATGDSGDLIADSSDLSFTVDATAYGLSQKGSSLFKGDKIIVRERIDATEYIAQGTVTSVDVGAGNVTVASWDSGGTFPSGGFTANASFFKWQREYFDLSDVTLGSHIDAVDELTLRVTNGNEGRTIWIDDMASNGDYMTTSTGSTISSSTGNRYMQYRTVFSSGDEAVSANLTDVTLDYTTDAPDLFLKFDENYGTTAYDHSINTLNSTITSATWRQEELCISRSCLEFDGSSSYVTRTDTDFLDAGTDDFTIGFWIRSNNATDVQRLIAKRDGYTGDGSDVGYEIYLQNGVVKSYVSDGSGGNTINSSSTTIFADGEWHYVAVVYDRDGNGQMYKDGVLDGQTDISARTATLSNTKDFSIGRSTAGTPGNYYDGFMDNVKFYRYARTAAQIKSDFLAGSVKGASAQYGPDNSYLSDGLVGYWKMDDPGIDTEGENITDSSGNGNSGTLYGDNGVGDNGTGMDCTVTGKFGTDCDFDGTDDYISFTRSTSIQNLGNEGAVSAWVNFDGLDATLRTILDIAGTGSNGLILFGSRTGSNVATLQYGDGTGVGLVIGTTVFSTGTWYHITGTWDSNGAKMYINGELENTDTTAPDISVGSGTSYIGSQTGTLRYLDGNVDEVRIYNRALSPVEVQGLYNWAPGPIGYWPMDENKGFIVNDKSGNANPGTLYDNSLISWWSLDEQSGTRVDSHGSNDLADNNTVLYQTGKQGNAADFEFDNTERLSIADNASLSMGDIDFSGTTWFQLEDASADRAILAKYTATGDQRSYFLQYSNPLNKIRIGASSSGTSGTVTWSPADTFGGLSTGTWYFVAFRHDATANTLEISVNGGAWDSVSHSGGAFDDTGNFTIGAFENASSPHDGLVDEANIWKKKLTDEEVTWLYNSGSGRNYDGTSANFDTVRGWTDGQFGSALSLDGSVDYIDVGNPTNLQNLHDGKMTASAWIYKDSNSGSDIIISKYDESPQEGWRFQTVQVSGGELSGVLLCSSTDGQSVTNETIPLDTWTHVAMTYDDGGDRKIDLYINGVEATYSTETACSGTVETDTNTDVYIGENFDATSRIFDGSIDEVKLYNYIRTSDQIIEDMNGGHPVGGSPIASQVGYWSLDEQSGSTAYDRGTGGNDGTITNTTWNLQDSCKINGCATFDGAADSINLGTGLNQSDTLTLSAWVKRDGTGEGGDTGSLDTIVGKWTNGTSTSSWVLYVTESSDKPAISVYTSSLLTAEGTTVLTDDVWHHIVGTYDGTTLKIYVDGILEGSTAVTGTPTQNSQIVYIGRSDDDTFGQFFGGSIDEVKIYSTALTQSQILIDMNGGTSAAMGGVLGASEKAGVIDGAVEPVGYWTFDEGSGDITDISGNSITLGNQSTVAFGRGIHGKGADFERSNSEYFEESDTSSDSYVFTAQPDEAASKDAYSRGTTNYNNGALYTGDQSGSRYKAWVEFDMSSIPSTATVTSATLQLYRYGGGVFMTTDDPPIPYTRVTRISRITSSWGETTVNYDNSPSINHTLANLTFGNTNGYKYWTLVTSYMQNYVDGTWTNYGFTIWNTAFCGAQGNCSHRFGSGGYGTAAHRPKLTINYNATVDSSATALNLTGDTTVSAWIKPESTTASTLFDIAGKWDDTDESYLLAQYGDEIRFYVESASNYETTDSLNLETDKWYHVTAVYDASAQTVKIYVNGRGEASTTTGTIPSSITSNTTGFFAIGAEDVGTTAVNFYDGVIDEVKIFDNALTQSQVSYDYNRGAPIGWWKLDECTGTTAYDLSKNGNGEAGGKNGTITIGSGGTNSSAGTCTGSAGEAWFDGAAGKLNASLDFDGTDDYVTIADHSLFDLTTDISISAWVKVGTNQISGIVGKDKGAGTDSPYILRVKDASGNFSFVVFDGASTYESATTTVGYSTGTWHHVTGTYDGVNIKIYVDGVLVDTEPATLTPTTSTGDIIIGDNPVAASREFDGQIDDVRIYNYPLSATQIKKLILGGGAVRFE